MNAEDRPYMCFDAAGALEVFEKKGQRAKEHRGPVDQLIGDGKVKSADSFTVLEVEGSCFRLVRIGHVWYQIPC